MSRSGGAYYTWLDRITLDDPSSPTVTCYERKVPASLVVIAIAARICPESIAERAAEIRRIVLKEGPR